jgi:hypothetical protein
LFCALSGALGYSADELVSSLGLMPTTDPANWWVAKLDPDGQPMWAADVARFEQGRPAAIAVAADGHTWIAGTFTGDIDLGQGPLKAQDERDGFLLELDEAGRPIWTMRIGTPAVDLVEHIVVDGGAIWVTGSSGDASPLPASGPGLPQGVEVREHELFAIQVER